MKSPIAVAFVLATPTTFAYAQKMSVSADPSAPCAVYRTCARTQGTPFPLHLASGVFTLRWTRSLRPGDWRR
jgi:hypothetical protein